jgi:hypothetical protein
LTFGDLTTLSKYGGWLCQVFIIPLSNSDIAPPTYRSRGPSIIPHSQLISLNQAYRHTSSRLRRREDGENQSFTIAYPQGALMYFVAWRFHSPYRYGGGFRIIDRFAKACQRFFRLWWHGILSHEWGQDCLCCKALDSSSATMALPSYSRLVARDHLSSPIG